MYEKKLMKDYSEKIQENKIFNKSTKKQYKFFKK